MMCAEETDWQLPATWLDEASREAAHARNLRREADQISKRYWAARADHSLTPAECDALECSRWSCLQEAARIERALRGLPELP